MATATSTPPAQPRAQLIHIEVDRRLGHEWDEWNGKPLPAGGGFSAPGGLFWRVAALTPPGGAGAARFVLYILAPRLPAPRPAPPPPLWPAPGAFPDPRGRWSRSGASGT